MKCSPPCGCPVMARFFPSQAQTNKSRHSFFFRVGLNHLVACIKQGRVLTSMQAINYTYVPYRTSRLCQFLVLKRERKKDKRRICALTSLYTRRLIYRLVVNSVTNPRNMASQKCFHETYANVGLSAN